MSYFAKVNYNTKLVEDVIVAEQDFVNNLPGLWIETSLDGSIGKNYAGIGFTYDFKKEAFIAPQPHPSWTLNEQSYTWEAPVAHPNDGQLYIWNEENVNWELIPQNN